MGQFLNAALLGGAHGAEGLAQEFEDHFDHAGLTAFLTAFLTTLLAAFLWCFLYDRHPNWLPLALSHALSSLAILASLDPGLTGRLRVGYSYLLLD